MENVTPEDMKAFVDYIKRMNPSTWVGIRELKLVASEENRTPQQAFVLNKGMYSVHYDDGLISRCMPRSIAKKYADRYGGTVKRHPHFKWWQLWVS